jgi:addiction module HigA family antidote
MTSRLTNEYAPDRVSPPGETLAETLAALGMTEAELAARLGGPKKTVNEVVKGKAAIEPDTALQLEAVLGVPAGFWMAREGRYRESLARQNRRQALEGGIEWARRFPFAQMVKLDWWSVGCNTTSTSRSTGATN